MTTKIATAGEFLAIRRRSGGRYTFHYWNGVHVDLWGVILLLLLVAGIGIWWQVHKRRTATMRNLSED